MRLIRDRQILARLGTPLRFLVVGRCVDEIPEQFCFVLETALRDESQDDRIYDELTKGGMDAADSFVSKSVDKPGIFDPRAGVGFSVERDDSSEIFYVDTPDETQAVMAALFADPSLGTYYVRSRASLHVSVHVYHVIANDEGVFVCREGDSVLHEATDCAIVRAW